jgi:hypothetical protein
MRLVSTVARGALAGAIGTLALDAVWYARYRRGGGDGSFPDWEFVHDLKDWSDAPAPGQVGRKIVAAAIGNDPPVEDAAAISNVMHWAYGASWGAGYAFLTSGRRRPHGLGLALGAAVWSCGYVTLPLLGIYEPIWKYDIPTLWKDLTAHSAYGAGTDLALRLFDGTR